MLALTLTSLLACQPSAWAPHCEAERSPAAMADVQESTGLSGDTLMRWIGGRHEQSAVLPDGSTQTLVIELERDLGEVRHVNQTQASPPEDVDVMLAITAICEDYIEVPVRLSVEGGGVVPSFQRSTLLFSNMQGMWIEQGEISMTLSTEGFDALLDQLESDRSEVDYEYLHLTLEGGPSHQTGSLSWIGEGESKDASWVMSEALLSW